LKEQQKASMGIRDQAMQQAKLILDDARRQMDEAKQKQMGLEEKIIAVKDEYTLLLREERHHSAKAKEKEVDKSKDKLTPLCEEHAAEIIDIHQNFQQGKDKLVQQLIKANAAVVREQHMWVHLSMEADRKLGVATEKLLEEKGRCRPRIGSASERMQEERRRSKLLIREELNRSLAKESMLKEQLQDLKDMQFTLQNDASKARSNSRATRKREWRAKSLAAKQLDERDEARADNEELRDLNIELNRVIERKDELLERIKGELFPLKQAYARGMKKVRTRGARWRELGCVGCPANFGTSSHPCATPIYSKEY